MKKTQIEIDAEVALAEKKQALVDAMLRRSEELVSQEMLLRFTNLLARGTTHPELERMTGEPRVDGLPPAAK